MYVRFRRRRIETYRGNSTRRNASTSYVLQCNTSFVVADPKGELLRATAPLLIEQGYDVKVFNLITPENSDGYNPFVYIRNDEDVIKLISNLIQNTTPKNANSNDPFWESATCSLMVKS